MLGWPLVSTLSDRQLIKTPPGSKAFAKTDKLLGKLSLLFGSLANYGQLGSSPLLIRPQKRRDERRRDKGRRDERRRRNVG